MGNIDGNIQAMGTQIAGDVVGNNAQLSHGQLLIIAKSGMAIITALAAWAACSKLPALFSLAVLSYQGIIQLAVPQMLGIFWKRGNKQGAIAGLVVGFIIASTLEIQFQGSVPWAYGLTSGVIGLLANFIVYVVCAYLFPHPQSERARIDALFESTSSMDDEQVPIATLPSGATAYSAK
jgi:SSS family solute:Na+ symporter